MKLRDAAFQQNHSSWILSRAEPAVFDGVGVVFRCGGAADLVLRRGRADLHAG